LKKEGLSMPRHQVTQLPDGYIIARIQGKHFPMKLELPTSGVPSARGFAARIDGKPVSYSKRLYAANFVKDWADGRIAWAALGDGERATLGA
jgi:hypothetical protein